MVKSNQKPTIDINEIGCPNCGLDNTKPAETETAKLKWKFIWSAIIAGVILWASIPGLSAFAPELFKNFYFQLLLATMSQFWIGWDFYRATYLSLKRRSANMDTLIAIGTSMAYFY